jgi:hypothetical protein
MALPFWCIALIVAIMFAPSMADARAGCPPSAPSGAPRVIFLTADPLSSKVTLTSASQAPIWKTITIGEYKGVNALRAAIDASPCRIGLGDSADEILGRPAFPYSKTRRQLDLVVVSVAALGFDADGAALRDVYRRAVRIGLELCPAEVGPMLRLAYLDQPIGESLHIAMRPVSTYDGELVDLTLLNGGAGLLLIGGEANPDLVLDGTTRLVFVRPGLDTVSGAKQPLPNELVTR